MQDSINNPALLAEPAQQDMNHGKVQSVTARMSLGAFTLSLIAQMVLATHGLADSASGNDSQPNAGQTGIAAVIPPLMKGRCTDAERLKMIEEAGGTPKVEEAVKKSLKWLKEQQNSDGSWGRKRKPAMTGLVLLCYLGHCEGTTSNEYGDTVTKGILT